MKFAILSCLFIVCLLNWTVVTFSCEQSDYQAFLKKFGRNHEEQVKNADYPVRFGLYCKGKKLIQETNAQNLGYDTQQWRWMDRTQQQMKKIIRLEISLVQLNKVASSMPTQQIRKVQATIPSSLDYRTKGDVSSIKDQGACGCCWSFTTVGLYESWMMFKGEEELDLSEQYILECTTRYTKNVLKLNYESSCAGATWILPGIWSESTVYLRNPSSLTSQAAGQALVSRQPQTSALSTKPTCLRKTLTKQLFSSAHRTPMTA